jgi:hypothetical protein
VVRTLESDHSREIRRRVSYHAQLRWKTCTGGEGLGACEAGASEAQAACVKRLQSHKQLSATDSRIPQASDLSSQCPVDAMPPCTGTTNSLSGDSMEGFALWAGRISLEKTLVHSFTQCWVLSKQLLRVRLGPCFGRISGPSERQSHH